MEGYETIESGMTFGTYDKDDIFRIEESQLYRNGFVNDLRTVEFVVWHREKLVFLEAKSSTPNYQNIDKSKEKTEKYHEFINSIAKKFEDSMNLYFSLITGRQSNSEVSEKLLKLDYSKINIVLVVVIKNAFKDSLLHYRDKLNMQLRTKMKIWNVKNIFLIDEETARQKGFVK